MSEYCALYTTVHLTTNWLTNSWLVLNTHRGNVLQNIHLRNTHAYMHTYDQAKLDIRGRLLLILLIDLMDGLIWRLRFSSDADNVHFTFVCIIIIIIIGIQNLQVNLTTTNESQTKVDQVFVTM